MKNRLAICLMAVLVPMALAIPASAAGNGQAIAFAGIAANGTLTTQGGLTATSASVLRNGPGDYTVTFGGKFVRGTVASQLALSSTAATPGGVFSSSSAVVLNASATQITVEVFTWDSALHPGDSNCFVEVFQGKAPPPPPSTAINIQDDLFAPSKLTINKGQTVHWTNKGGEQHSVNSNPGASNCAPTSAEAFESPTLNPGDNFDHTFNASGTFAYHCEFHGCPMKGTITVN